MTEQEPKQPELINCPVPGCISKFEKTPERKSPLCDKHTEWLDFLLWALPKVQIIQRPPTITKPGIVLPRNFNPKGGGKS